ncbi:chymotrypsin-like elastase family member 2A isoform X2 [Epargyreus clarus]
MTFNTEVNINVGKSVFDQTAHKLWGTFKVLRVTYEGIYDSTFEVYPTIAGVQPVIESMSIDNEQYCRNYAMVYTGHIGRRKPIVTDVILTPEEECGKRKMEYTELVFYGESTKPGDWPWHVAIFKKSYAQKTYACGGTLITRNIVLTAGHCVTTINAPDSPSNLAVVLGKHTITHDEATSQERDVHSVIVHENFRTPKYTDNDIALLKLKTEASYNNYVQPACIWYDGAYDKLPTSRIMGSVVGWGLDETFNLSPELRHATMPEVSFTDCVMKKPTFYALMLSNSTKFCAGWGNGTSACNGDSGGGYFVFVPDVAKNSSPTATGAWYVKGIISVAVAKENVGVCDPDYYVLFTDISKYKDWIRKHADIITRT